MPYAELSFYYSLGDGGTRDTNHSNHSLAIRLGAIGWRLKVRGKQRRKASLDLFEEAMAWLGAVFREVKTINNSVATVKGMTTWKQMQPLVAVRGILKLSFRQDSCKEWLPHRST